MKILANLGTLKDGRTALVIEDAYHPNFVIVSDYDKNGPIGQKWSSGVYFDGDLIAFTNAIQQIQLGVSLETMASHFKEVIYDQELDFESVANNVLYLDEDDLNAYKELGFECGEDKGMD